MDGERDEVIWALDNPKTFSTKSLYSFISNWGISMKEGDNSWKIKHEDKNLPMAGRA
jgi:hypothetical protein